jgi:tight adherence protein B
MKLLRLGLALAATLVVTAAPAHAEELPLEVQDVDTTAYPTVAVDVTPPGADEATLPAGAFTVTEGGREVAATVGRISGEELEVVLVIDTSGSMQGAPMEAAKAAAGAFVNRMPPQARIAVVGFGPTAVVASPLTADRASTHVAISGLTPVGETALFDAVSLAARQFSPTAGRRSVVVLSDGADTASVARPEEVQRDVSAARARVDAAVLRSPESDAAVLGSLAASGGGRAVEVAGPEALDAVYDEVATRLVSTYRVSWESRGTGSTDVDVAVALGDDTAVGRTRVELPEAAEVRPPEQAPAPARDERSEVRTWALVAGAGAVFLSMAVLGLMASTRGGGVGRRRERLARLGSAPAEGSFPGVGELAERASAAAEGALERRGWRASLSAALERAGVDLRPGELLVLSGTAVAVSFLIGAVLVGPVAGLALAAVAAAAPKLIVSVKTAKRRRAFSEQLPDTLQIMAGSLRAGYGLVQAVDTVAREAPSPTLEEFRRVVFEHRLGRDLTDALRSMAERLGTEDLEWFAQAVDIHREVGGDLASILDTVAGTIRERGQLDRQVQALTAEGRLSAYVLTALPIVLALALQVINPGYLDALTEGMGLLLGGGAVVSLVVGGLWFRKLCRFAI